MLELVFVKHQLLVVREGPRGYPVGLGELPQRGLGDGQQPGGVSMAMRAFLPPPPS